MTKIQNIKSLFFVVIIIGIIAGVYSMGTPPASAETSSCAPHASMIHNRILHSTRIKDIKISEGKVYWVVEDEDEDVKQYSAPILKILTTIEVIPPDEFGGWRYRTLVTIALPDPSMPPEPLDHLITFSYESIPVRFRPTSSQGTLWRPPEITKTDDEKD